MQILEIKKALIFLDFSRHQRKFNKNKKIGVTGFEPIIIKPTNVDFVGFFIFPWEVFLPTKEKRLSAQSLFFEKDFSMKSFRGKNVY